MTDSPNPAAVRDELRDHLADVLYCEPGDVDDDATFADLGLDSVLGVELISVINGKYGLTELVEVVYEQGTLTKLAEHICTRVSAAGTLPS